MSQRDLSFLEALDDLAASVVEVQLLLTQSLSADNWRKALKRRVKNLIGFARFVEALFTSDAFLQSRIDMLYRRVGREAVAEVVVNGQPILIRRKVTALDMVESMVLHDIAFRDGARRLFKDAVLDMLENTVVNAKEGRMTLREYFERKGYEWGKVREYLEREVEVALTALRRELELYEKPEPGRSVRGERVAYYMYVKEKLARANPVWAKILGAVTASVSYSVGVAIASRRVGDWRGLSSATRRNAALLEVVRELIGNPPDRLVSRLMEADDPYDELAKERERLERRLDEALKRAGSRNLDIKLSIPVVPGELRVIEKRVSEARDEVIEVGREKAGREAT